MLFGTFKNPAEYGPGEVGFESPADGRYGAMLLTRDVSESVGTRVQTGGQTGPAQSVLASGSG
jgi:hypothetical protein